MCAGDIDLTYLFGESGRLAAKFMAPSTNCCWRLAVASHSLWASFQHQRLQSQKKGPRRSFSPTFGSRDAWRRAGGGSRERRDWLLKQQPAMFDLVLDHDFGWDDGLICAASLRLILPNAQSSRRSLAKTALREQTFNGVARTSASGNGGDSTIQQFNDSRVPNGLRRTRLIRARFGSLAQATCQRWRLWPQLDFEVTVFDDRRRWPIIEFSRTTRLRVDSWEKLLQEAMPAPRLRLIVTRGHQHDALVLPELGSSAFAFWNDRSTPKERLIFSEFVEQGIATEEQ